MGILSNILFALLLIIGIGFFIFNCRKLIRNIKLGKEVDTSNHRKKRWKNMIRVALGQQKMTIRPIAGVLHIIVYIGFFIINIEMLEIVIDGLFGTHRVLKIMGKAYDFIIACFEFLAFLVITSIIIFWIRRNIIRLQRFCKPEMKGWAKKDGNIILYTEALIMFLFLLMNTMDYCLQELNVAHYQSAGSFPISSKLSFLFSELSVPTMIIIERSAWWLHIIGVLFFLNYLYYSKHLHIILAFPNTFFASIKPIGQFENLTSVTQEVKMMIDPNTDPFATSIEDNVPEKFGASDVTDLNWVQLLNAYTCTECGRCTDECPANQTGKLLSPRKIMMSTRDRLEEIGRNIDKNKGKFKDDGKQLLNDYISSEELWACTSCNACVEACPVSINPLSIIMDMRQFLVMEQSKAPSELNIMMNNIENNGAPWAYHQLDRMKWAEEN